MTISHGDGRKLAENCLRLKDPKIRDWRRDIK